MIHQFIEDYTSLPLSHALMVGVNRDDQQCALSAGIDFIWADEWR
jgi:phosphoglycolate phosphatase-like HAD superfamily hydrolase